jgi:Tol biopolymer transport system component
VVAVAPPPTATVGPTSAMTKTVAAITPTRIVPAAKGILGFIAFDPGQNSYTLNNLFVNPRSFSGFKLLGTMPFDLAQPSRALSFAWSPDGSRVVYVFGQSGAQNILRMAKSGTDIDIALVSNPGISSPTWSPDSKTVAYVGVGGGPAAIFTINPDGGPAQKFFPRDPNRPPEDFRGIAWGNAYMLAASNETGAYEIWRINSDGSGAMQLTADKRDNSAPAWSPDGKEFAYSSKQVDGTYQIMLANIDGSNARKITNAGNNFSPSWSPDGNWIAFTSTRGGRMDVYIADKSGGNVQVLTDKYPAESQLPGSWR